MTFAVTLLPILILVIAVVAIALIGFVVTRGRRTPAPPGETISKPPPAPPPVLEKPPAPRPVVETPPAPPPPVLEKPPAPPRRRVRSIGASVARLFRGATLTPEQWEELEELLLRADVGVSATQRIVGAL